MFAGGVPMKGEALKLFHLTENCWYSESDQTYDRPSLGYIRGRRASAAVDTGASPAHYAEFLEALDREGLPRPSAVVITHWHWDHTMGMSAAGVPVAACEKTQEHLRDMASWGPEQKEDFFKAQYYVRQEYSSPDQLCPRTADIVFRDVLELDLGGVTVKAEHVEGPHSDDSVLVYIPEDGMIFAGDSSAGDFSKPNIAYDPDLLKKYTDKVLSMEFGMFLHSHRQPTDRKETEEFLAQAAERGYYTY